MKWLILLMAWFAFLFGGFVAFLCWCLYFLTWSGITAAISATGFLILGYYWVSDEVDAHRDRVDEAQRAAPAYTVSDEVVRVAFGGRYNKSEDG